MISKSGSGLVLFAAALVLSSPAGAQERPGQRFTVSAASLPAPYATPGVDNHSTVIARPKGALPQVPRGFAIRPYVTGLTHPRFMALAPNGDVFLTEAAADKVTRIHDGKASTFADGFSTPSGIAFHDGALYVGDLKAVWRLAYKNGASQAGVRNPESELTLSRRATRHEQNNSRKPVYKKETKGRTRRIGERINQGETR